MKIIAESAFNHNGNLDYLLELATVAKSTGTDYFTVQVMDVDSFCAPEYSKYQIYTETAFSREQWIRVFEHCKALDLEVIPCILDESSFDFCYEYGFRILKIHATDINNLPFLQRIANFDIEILLETQCATLFDIRFALNYIGRQVVAIFHGFSNYPTDYELLQLNALDAIRKEFPNYETGLADHSLDTTEIPLMALAKGVKYLEKHITLSRSNRNFDYQVSLYPEEFTIMVNQVKKYTRALGKNIKHPIKDELVYRTIMYKKFIGDDQPQIRRDGLNDYATSKFHSFPKDSIGVALIARLKSQRLRNKVLMKIGEKELIKGLYERMAKSRHSKTVHLATSWLHEDQPLVEFANENNIPVFCGHPESVIDRLLEYAFQNKLGGVFRVTGDNPFTSSELVDQMIELFIENDLDYVRVNGVPFGVSAELFSTRYLWDLYLKMDNPMYSEYLSWFILNDKDCRKGVINFDFEDNRISLVNLSVDYREDFDRVVRLVNSSGKGNFTDINFSEVIKNLDLDDIIQTDKLMKLPGGQTIYLHEYISLIKESNYSVQKSGVL